MGDTQTHMTDGSVAIAAITSCTNTSNPSVMIAAGLVAKHAVERGLSVNPTVKTSLAPGSRAVIDYLNNAELMPYLEALRFHLVGFGCTTCIGNSGPLPEPVAEAVQENDLVVAAVSERQPQLRGAHSSPGARQFPGLAASWSWPMRWPERSISTLPKTRLVMDINGEPVYLRDIWPTQEEVRDVVARAVTPEVFSKNYAHVFEGDEQWRSLAETYRRTLQLGPRLYLYPGATVLPGYVARARAGEGYSRGARAGYGR